MTALDLLRARFPESEGWTARLKTNDALARMGVAPCHASASKRIGGDVAVTLSAWGDTEEAAASALIAAWDAATHAEKVRGLVRRVEEVQSIAEDRGDVQDGPEGQPVPNSWMVMGTMLREALAALPEHWKEGVRGK